MKKATVDETIANGPALVIAPHPDDETLGCGALIARKVAAGNRVRVVVVTDGGGNSPYGPLSNSDLVSLRRQEAASAVAALGLSRSDLTFLNFADKSLVRQPESVQKALGYHIAAEPVDQVFVTSGADTHPDHRACHRAVLECVNLVPWPIRVLEYPVWFWDAWPWYGQPSSVAEALRRFIADPIVELRDRKTWLVKSAPFLEVKRRALNEYRSQTTDMAGDGTWPKIPDEIIKRALGPHEVFFDALDRG